MNLFKKAILLSFVFVVFNSFASTAIAQVPIAEKENYRLTAYYIHTEAFKNFTYVTDGEKLENDKWYIFDVNNLFEGDCEDFAFSMQYAVKAGSVWLVKTKDAGEAMFDHAVFTYGGIVFELNGEIYTLKEYKDLGNSILYHLGSITPEQR